MHLLQNFICICLHTPVVSVPCIVLSCRVTMPCDSPPCPICPSIHTRKRSNLEPSNLPFLAECIDTINGNQPGEVDQGCPPELPLCIPASTCSSKLPAVCLIPVDQDTPSCVQGAELLRLHIFDYFDCGPHLVPCLLLNACHLSNKKPMFAVCCFLPSYTVWHAIAVLEIMLITPT